MGVAGESVPPAATVSPDWSRIATALPGAMIALWTSRAAVASTEIFGQFFLHQVGERCGRSRELTIDACEADASLLPQNHCAAERQHDQQCHRVPRRSGVPAARAALMRCRSAPRADSLRRGGSGSATRSRSIELAAQPLHIDVDDVRKRIVVFVPDVLGDLARG